jgi:transmembrane sensor
LAEAAEWFVVLASGEVGSEDRQRWLDWRAADPVNEQAWQRAHAASERFATIPRSGVRAALSALVQKSRSRGRLVAPLMALLSVGIGGWHWYQRSDISADAHSAIDIEFSGAERLVRLRRGRIMIETAHEPADRHRPFSVATDEGRVTALGTRFTVERDAQDTRVVVLEARVSIETGNSAGRLIMEAGHTARFTRDGIEQSISGPSDGSWSRGIFVADNLGLCDFLAEIARYRQSALVCDSDAAPLRISGAFPLRDTDRVLAALGDTLPVEIGKNNAGDGPVDIVRAKPAAHLH